MPRLRLFLLPQTTRSTAAMHRRTGLAATMIFALTLAPFAASAASAAPAVVGQVSKAELQADGSVKARLAMTCPANHSFETQVAISQEFESIGGYIAAIAYSPTTTGTCTGRPMRFAVQTTPSDRAAFQRDSGKHRPANATRPTLGSVLLTVTAADGSPSSYSKLDNNIVLR